MSEARSLPELGKAVKEAAGRAATEAGEDANTNGGTKSGGLMSGRKDLR